MKTKLSGRCKNQIIFCSSLTKKLKHCQNVQADVYMVVPPSQGCFLCVVYFWILKSHIKSRYLIAKGEEVTNSLGS